MGKLVIKQGFLGLGKPLVKWFCDECNAECGTPYTLHNHTLCRVCANRIDPDLVHMWPSRESMCRFDIYEFFQDTADGNERHIAQCSACLGLLSVIRWRGVLLRRYFRVGTTLSVEYPFPCEEHSGYNEKGEVKVQGSCLHNFIKVGTSKQVGGEAQQKYEQMLRARNITVEQMHGTGILQIQYFCFGSTHYWCVKCGMYMHLNPQRENLLPVRGRISR